MKKQLFFKNFFEGKQNIIILILVSLVIAVVTYALFFSHQYPEIKNRSYFHCTENPSEWDSYRLENFEIYDVRIKENKNVYVTIVKFYKDREFLEERYWGHSGGFPYKSGRFASFKFDTEKYLVFSIPTWNNRPPDYFVLNRFNLTAQIITQSFLSKENKKLSYGNRNVLNDEVDELVTKMLNTNNKSLKEFKVTIFPVQIQCAKVLKPTKKI
jgi:hypothetical protein